MESVDEEGRKEMFYLTMHSTHFIYGYMESVDEEGRKEMFYLTTHSTHFIYSYMESGRGRKEGNVLFNDALNTFYLRLYGVGRRGPLRSGFIYPLPQHIGYFFTINMRTQHILFTVIWRRTYGKGPLR